MSPQQRVSAVTVALLTLVAALWGPVAPAVSAQQPGDTDRSSLPRGTVAAWEPRYTSYVYISETEDLVSLALDGEALWLATDRYVSRFQRGVWEQPQPQN